MKTHLFPEFKNDRTVCCSGRIRRRFNNSMGKYTPICECCEKSNPKLKEVTQ